MCNNRAEGSSVGSGVISVFKYKCTEFLWRVLYPSNLHLSYGRKRRNFPSTSCGFSQDSSDSPHGWLRSAVAAAALEPSAKGSCWGCKRPLWSRSPTINLAACSTTTPRQLPVPQIPQEAHSPALNPPHSPQSWAPASQSPCVTVGCFWPLRQPAPASPPWPRLANAGNVCMVGNAVLQAAPTSSGPHISQVPFQHILSMQQLLPWLFQHLSQVIHPLLLLPSSMLGEQSGCRDGAVEGSSGKQEGPRVPGSRGREAGTRGGIKSRSLHFWPGKKWWSPDVSETFGCLCWMPLEC